MKNTLLKYSSLFLLAASLVFTSCKKDEPAPVAPPVNSFTVADGKVGLKLSNAEWFADSVVSAVYSTSTRLLNIKSVKYNPGTKTENTVFVVYVFLDRTTPNKTYTANYSPFGQTGEIIFFGSAAEDRDYAINPGEYSSVGEFTVSNFNATTKRVTIDLKNLVFTRNGKSTTIVEGKLNNVKLK